MDVYGLTKRRDLATVNQFLDEYVDRGVVEDRSDEEIGLEPLDAAAGEEEWEWEPALTLTHIVERGLARPRRAFTAYAAAHVPGVERVILGFTRDDQLVLGLSIYSGQYEEDERRARAALAHLAQAYACHFGLIVLETAPPLSEAEFRNAPHILPVVFSTEFEA